MPIKTFITNSIPSSDLSDIRVFKIDTANTTYAIEILDGYVNNAYWGEKLENDFDIQAGLEFNGNQFQYSKHYT